MFNRVYIEEKIFEKNNFETSGVPIGDYEGCRFNNCNFSSADLGRIHFIDCVFNSCNISVAKLHDASFRNVMFLNCKLFGLIFQDTNNFLFAAGFDGCILNNCSFYKMNLKKIGFKNCVLNEIDFSEADLSHAVFENCDLLKSVFENTILEKADLRTSYNYSINPEINKIKKAKFSLPAAIGLLDKYDIILE